MRTDGPQKNGQSVNQGGWFRILFRPFRVHAGLALGVLAAILSAAVVSGAIVAVGQQPSDPETHKSPPSDALRPNQVTELPAGTPAAQANLPTVWGNIRVVPTGGIPETVDLQPLKPGARQVDVRRQQGTSISDCSEFALFVAPPTMLPGWTFAGCSQQTIVWDDGTTLTFNYYASWVNPSQFPITLSRGLVPVGQEAEVVASGAPFATTLGVVGGADVIVDHQAPGAKLQGPLDITFMTGNIENQVEGAGLPLTELTTVAAGIIAGD